MPISRAMARSVMASGPPEAIERGHPIKAFSRDAAPAQDEERRDNITWTSVHVLDPKSIAGVLPGLDVLISGFQPGNAAKDFAETIRRSIADPTVYATAA